MSHLINYVIGFCEGHKIRLSKNIDKNDIGFPMSWFSFICCYICKQITLHEVMYYWWVVCLKLITLVYLTRLVHRIKFSLCIIKHSIMFDIYKYSYYAAKKKSIKSYSVFFFIFNILPHIYFSKCDSSSNLFIEHLKIYIIIHIKCIN